MPLSVFEKVQPFLKYYGKVLLQGWGEPLLHPNIIDIVQSISSKSEVIVSTNGELPVPRGILAAVHTVVFRLGSGKARTYELANPEKSFNRVIFNISRAISERNLLGNKGPRIVLSLLKNMVTLQELPEYLTLAARLKVDKVVLHEPRFHVRPIDEEAILQEALPADAIVKEDEALSRHARRLGIDIFMDSNAEACPYHPGKDIFVNWKGQVSPCRYNHLPVINGKYTFYHNGLQRTARPLYLGYLSNVFELQRHQYAIAHLARRMEKSDNEGTWYRLPADKSRSQSFAVNCPLRNLPVERYHGLCV